MAKITLHVTPSDAAELAAITAALAPFVSSGAPAAAEKPAPAAAEEAPKPKRRAPRKAIETWLEDIKFANQFLRSHFPNK